LKDAIAAVEIGVSLKRHQKILAFQEKHWEITQKLKENGVASSPQRKLVVLQYYRQHKKQSRITFTSSMKPDCLL